MTTEKLAKAFLTPPGGRYPNTHDAFVRIVRGRQDYRTACGFNQATQFQAYVDSLLPLAQAVENLSPDGGDHPNPEYPWASNGIVIVPVEHPFPDLNLQSPKMLKLLKFIDICLTLAQ